MHSQLYELNLGYQLYIKEADSNENQSAIFTKIVGYVT